MFNYMRLEAWFQLNDAARVEDLLREMDASNSPVRPNSESFSKVIRAWLQDELQSPYGLPGTSCENAWRWLKELARREKEDNSDLGTALDLFSNVLKTAAMTSARGDNVLSVGLQTFWAWRESRFGINSFAYAWLLEIGLKVLSSPKDNKKREDFIKNLTKHCCKDGLMSRKFVRELADGVVYDEGWTAEESKRMCDEVLGEPPFPFQWSRNLPQGQDHPPQPIDLERKNAGADGK